MELQQAFTMLLSISDPQKTNAIRKRLRIHVAVATILVTLITAFTSTAAAKEGFNAHSRELPSKVAKAWASTFLFISEDLSSYQMGTAFLVKKEVKADSTILYFLTSRHVITPFCKDQDVCFNANLAQNASLIHQNDGLHLQSLDGVVVDGVEVLALSKNPDLALLRAAVPTGKYNLPDSLKISDSCALQEGETLFSIGFADPACRTNSDRLPIADQNLILKRWSQGIFTGYVKSDDNNDENTNIWASTSVDMLSGGSGSPLLNEDGLVVGVIKNSASHATNQYRYDGNENPGHFDWQSNAVPCAYLSQFIHDGINAN